MRKRLGKILLLIMAGALVVAATACSSYTGKEWRHSSGSTAVVVLSIPDTNDHYLDGNTPLDNQEEWFVETVQEAGATWNSHPDLTVIVHVEEPGVNTCDLWRSAPDTDWNCVEMWLETNAHMGSHSPGSGGLAFRWGTSQFYTNGNAELPARVEFANDWSTQGANEVIARRTAMCHEVGHMLGLEHATPVDHDGDPGTPNVQPEGPCTQALDANPDRDTNISDGQQLGFDWDNIDDIYDMCTTWPTGAPGAGPDAADDLSTIGYDSCGGGALSASEARSADDQAVERFKAAAKDARERGLDRKPYRAPPGTKAFEPVV